MKLAKYSIGIGDRFGHQGRAQLQALVEARRMGIDIVPVWNKSHREHTIMGTTPADVRREADDAVAALAWDQGYFVDADHITMATADGFLASSDFFTLDVADCVGREAPEPDQRAFVERNRKYLGKLEAPGLEEPLEITEAVLQTVASQFLLGCQEAARIYRHIKASKAPDSFVTEVSFDETDTPQRPAELLFILAALADEGVPAQTIAPKFSGRFNKGVDYAGDVKQFTREFEADVAVTALAAREFGLPESLKLSVHSGSDKFSVYGAICDALRKHDAGLHLKTAGTTWLEELIGLALAGGEALELAKRVYVHATVRYDELCAPYASVLDIDRSRLPKPLEVTAWSGAAFAAALRHDPKCPAYNPHFRQLLHVGYKVAAELKDRFFSALGSHQDIVARNVKENILARHLLPVFGK